MFSDIMIIPSEKDNCVLRGLNDTLDRGFDDSTEWVIDEIVMMKLVKTQDMESTIIGIMNPLHIQFIHWERETQKKIGFKARNYAIWKSHLSRQQQPSIIAH